MPSMTEAEMNLSAKALNRDTAARRELEELGPRWWERAVCGLAAGAVVLFSAKWHELPLAAGALLTGCAAAMPYLYFELRRLRKQVNAISHLILHTKRGDA